MPTTPPTITAAPPAPQRQVKATFSDRVDAFVTWMAAAVSQFGAVATNVYGNAVQAYDAAVAAVAAAVTATDAAAAASSTAGATLWVSGQSVAQYAAKISPLDHHTYRRKTATGAGTTDPSLDGTNYTLLSLGPSALVSLGVATVSSPVANIDFLNLFSDMYNKYIIELSGITPSDIGYSPSLSLTLAASGTVTATTLGMSQVAPDSGGLSGTVQIINARAAGKAKVFTLDTAALSTYGNNTTLTAASNSYGFKTDVAESGFRLSFSAGATIAAGTVRVYGVRNP